MIYQSIAEGYGDGMMSERDVRFGPDLSCQQEDIPVGYVPPASVAVWRGGGFCLGGVSRGVCVFRGCLPGGGVST